MSADMDGFFLFLIFVGFWKPKPPKKNTKTHLLTIFPRFFFSQHCKTTPSDVVLSVAFFDLTEELEVAAIEEGKVICKSFLLKDVSISTLQGINISHLGKRKIIFKMPFLGGYVSSLEGISNIHARNKNMLRLIVKFQHQHLLLWSTGANALTSTASIWVDFWDNLRRSAKFFAVKILETRGSRVFKIMKPSMSRWGVSSLSTYKQTWGVSSHAKKSCWNVACKQDLVYIYGYGEWTWQIRVGSVVLFFFSRNEVVGKTPEN